MQWIVCSITEINFISCTIKLFYYSRALSVCPVCVAGKKFPRVSSSNKFPLIRQIAVCSWKSPRRRGHARPTIPTAKMTATKLLGVDDVKISLQKFGWQDYLMFVLMLAICAMVGIYFGFIKKKPKKTDDETDYLVGGRQMKVFPIAMSLIATFISGISLLGTPTEIYVYGIQYMYVIGGVITMGFIMMYVYLPVFHDLKLTSTYEVT